MLRKPIFGQTVYWLVQELYDEAIGPVWLTEWDTELVEDDDLEEWFEMVKSNVGVMPIFKAERQVMSNAQYNREHIIGRPFDEYDTIILDEDCPKCSHLLYEIEEKGSLCTNHDCDYKSAELIAYQEKIRGRIGRDAPPEPQFREEGQTLEQFIEKYKFRIDDTDRKCVMCHQVVSVSDFYRTKGYAIIVFGNGHADGCKNGPSIAIPQGETAKEWANLLGGGSDDDGPRVS